MTAILFALEIEAGGLIDMLGEKTTTRANNLTVHQGKLGGKTVLVGVLGTGAERASEAARTFIEAHKPERIVLAGFSGGLQPSLHRLDIVLVDEEGVKLILLGANESKPALLPKGSFGKVGPILTVDEVVHSAEAKKQLGLQTGALVADMESAPVTQVCNEFGIPFSNMRIVIDAMDEELPEDIQKLTDQPSTSARIGAAIGAIWRRPSSLKDMVKLKEYAIESSDRLARFLSKLYL